MAAPIKPWLLLDIKTSSLLKLMGTNGRADTAGINHRKEPARNEYKAFPSI